MALFSVKNLSKSYDGKKVVDGVSFEVKKKEIFGILGPNGAGKTTTLEMCEALRPIDEGEVTIGGLNVASQPTQVKEIIGVQLQTSAFFDHLNLVEILKMFSALYDQDVDVHELLEDVGLSKKAKSYTKHLSGGQRQRFSIVSALVNKPKVLFLDEPTTGLDPQARRNVWDLIQEIRDKGITIVMTTHYMDEAELLCDRIAIMDQGKIVKLDTPDGLIDDLLAKGFKKKKEVKLATLEDVFIDLTGKELRD